MGRKKQENKIIARVPQPDAEDYLVLDISTRKYPNTYMNIDASDLVELKRQGIGRICPAPALNGEGLCARSRIDNKVYSIHQLLLPNVRHIEHISGDSLDNRRKNLRPVAPHLRLPHDAQTCTSIFPGVSWNSDRQMWVAQCNVNGKRKYLGSYEEETDAAQAYIQQQRIARRLPA